MQSILEYRRLEREIRDQVRGYSTRHLVTVSRHHHVNSSRDVGNLCGDRRIDQSPSGTPSTDLHTIQGNVSSPHEDIKYQRQSSDIEPPSVDSPRSDSADSHREKSSNTYQYVNQGCDLTEKNNSNGQKMYIISFKGNTDGLDPHNWSLRKKWIATAIVGSTGFLVGWSSAIDSSIIEQARKEFGVSDVVESLSTGLYLVALGIGALFSAPFSETVGRNPVYITTLLLFMVFVMASGLAPNIGAQLTFRFLAGLSGCAPFTTFGASVSDIWLPGDRTFVFPICTCLSFIGPFISPLVGAYIGQSSLISWRWTEWTTLIIAAIIVSAIVLFLPETYGPILLKWKANHLRKILRDERFEAEIEIRQISLPKRLAYSVYRPFDMFCHEIMVVLFTLYLVVVYIVLFTFLTGYTFIYGDVYGFSQGSTGLCFAGLDIGFLVALAIVPWIHQKYSRDLATIIEKGGNKLPPEERLWYAILGAPCLPVSLFWMGWTSFPSISYWSSLVASVLFGFGVMGIFISTYQYLIDSFEMYAASALVSATFMRYIVAGGMVAVSFPMYENLGVHWTLTVLGCIALIMMPIPYIFYKYGARIRKNNSTFATREQD